ncbi:MAG: glycoside hydrolase family 5 protein, partial [Trebonia sp.]
MTDHPPPPATQQAATTAASAAEQANRLLARTLNIGVNLGAPAEAGWAVPLGPRELDRCSQAGFTAVRLVVSLAQHRSPASSLQVDPAVLDPINDVIESAGERGLAVVLANEIDPELMSDPPRHRDRLLTSTRQLAAGLRHHGADVMLEPLSEPQAALDLLWNDYLADVIAAVRDADSDRTIV